MRRDDIAKRNPLNPQLPLLQLNFTLPTSAEELSDQGVALPSPVRRGRRKLPSKSPRGKRNDPNRDLKWGIWAYFLLLVFEGALRKWGPPALATPLLIVRDPLALGLLGMAWFRGKLPLNPYVLAMACVGILGAILALTAGHGSLPVAIYGARIFLFHFPLMFVIGEVFKRDDVVKMGEVTLWIAGPIAVLTGLQFYSPQSAWVNLGIAGDLSGSGFSGALGFYRPSGTFAFTNGNTLFFSLVACFVFYFWLERQKFSNLILVLATAGLLISIPLSISRGLLFQVCLSLLFALAAVARRPKYLAQTIIAGCIVVLGLTILSQTQFFMTATAAFQARFEAASDHEGGLQGTLMDRFFGGLLAELETALEQPVLGQGIGMGTNVGSSLLSGNRDFLIAEGEWARMIGELGAFIGVFAIAVRLVLCWKVLTAAYERLAVGDLLPWMLLSFGMITLAQGGWGQPTALGFSTLIGGLLLAALKAPTQAKPRPRKRRKRMMVSTTAWHGASDEPPNFETVLKMERGSSSCL